MEGLDPSELVLLTFAKSETENLLQWEHSREFEYGGEMYDVVETRKNKDSVSYLCWWDNEETKLNQQLSKLLDHAWNGDPCTEGKQHQLISFWISQYFQHTSSLPVLITSESSRVADVYSLELTVRAFAPLGPPPKFV